MSCGPAFSVCYKYKQQKSLRSLTSYHTAQRALHHNHFGFSETKMWPQSLFIIIIHELLNETHDFFYQIKQDQSISAENTSLESWNFGENSGTTSGRINIIVFMMNGKKDISCNKARTSQRLLSDITTDSTEIHYMMGELVDELDYVEANKWLCNPCPVFC